MSPVHLADDSDTIPTDDHGLLATLRAEATAPTAAVVDWASATTNGHVRRRNEDALGNFERSLFVVADGMGGYEGGDLAAQTAVRGLLSTAASRGIDDWPVAIAQLNDQIRMTTRARGHDRAGTTLVAVSFLGPVATVAHVGDSRAYRLRNGRLDQLTTDHSVQSELEATGVDVGHYREKGLPLHALTRHLGGPGGLGVPDVTSLVPFAGDRILLASDGAYRQIPESALAAAVGRGSCTEAAQEIVRLADDAGGKDNATAIVIALEAPSR